MSRIISCTAFHRWATTASDEHIVCLALNDSHCLVVFVGSSRSCVMQMNRLKERTWGRDGEAHSKPAEVALCPTIALPSPTVGHPLTRVEVLSQL
jgi:hypothetical protein